MTRLNKRERESLCKHLDRAIAQNPGSPYVSIYAPRRLIERLRATLAVTET